MMGDEITWLIATATVGAGAFIAYLYGILRHKKSFDLNAIVPLLLSCAVSVAAIKMMLLAFTLPRAIRGQEVASLFDAGSILVGGFVFMVTALYGVIKIVANAYAPKQTTETERTDDGTV